MISPPLLAATPSQDYLLALAQGLSGLLGITVAVLIFVLDRQVRRFRVHDQAYIANLGVLIAVSGFTILLAALAWWAWASTAPDIELLFCWSPELWLGLIFGGVVFGSTVSLVFGIVALVLHWRGGRDDNWEP